MNELLTSQISCMVLLLIGTLFFGFLPVFVNKLFRCECQNDTCESSCHGRKIKTVSNILIYFGGGVLLATCILHLLPDARDGFENKADNESYSMNSSENVEPFPIPEFVVCMGFFIVYLFEEIVHYFLDKKAIIPSEISVVKSSSFCTSSNSFHTMSSELTSSKKYSVENIPKGTSQPSYNHQNHPHSSSFSALFAVAALSLHSLFEGFAVGLRPNAASTWIVFASIAVHKYVIAFVIGLEVLTLGGKNKQVYIHISVLSSMSPIGMVVAMLTQKNLDDGKSITVSTLNALATGTLLYVTFFEILQRDQNRNIATWIQFLATTTGFAVIAIAQFSVTFF